MSRISAQARRDSISARGPGCVAWVFCGVFALVGLGAAYVLTFQPVYRVAMAQGWQETTCVVTSSRVASSSSGDTYSVEVRYTYEFDGVTFEGDRYNFDFGSSSGRESKDRIVEGLPEGSEVPCWVDPGRPESSVLNRAPGLYLLWGLFPLPFVLVGVGGLFLLWHMRGRAGRERRRAVDIPDPEPPGAVDAGIWQQAVQKAAGPRAVDADAVMELKPDPLGHLVLEPGSTRKSRVVGIGVFGLLWNGFVAFFLIQTGFFGSDGGGPDVFLALVLVPFVLVGVGMIALFFHQLLALWNPSPHLRLTLGRPQPGSEALLEWHLTGSSERIRRFTVQLEGRESATYTRGTDRRTDHHVFFERELFSTDHLRADRGTITLPLPKSLIPTFEAPSNKIGYRIRVHGEIGLWPDVAESFPFPVYPPELPDSPDRSSR